MHWSERRAAMNRIETKILNCFAVKEAEKNMVFAARLTQRGHIIHSMNDLVDLYNQSFTNETSFIHFRIKENVDNQIFYIL